MTRPPLLPRRGASREDAQEAHQRLGTEAMASDWSRRIADVADRGLGRLKWAESAPPRGVSGRTGVRAKTAFPLRARNSLHRPKRPFRCAVPAARSPPRAVSSVSDRVRFHLVGDIVGLTNCQCHDRQRWVLRPAARELAAVRPIFYSLSGLASGKSLISFVRSWPFHESVVPRR